MTTTMPALPTGRSDYPYWITQQIRFADLDRLGHVNNNALSVYCESSRVEMLESVLPGSTFGRGPTWTIVRHLMEFRAQAHYPGTIEVGGRFDRIGRSSLALSQVLYLGESLVVTAESICVLTDLAEGKSLPIPDDWRDKLGRYLMLLPP